MPARAASCSDDEIGFCRVQYQSWANLVLTSVRGKIPELGHWGDSRKWLCRSWLRSHGDPVTEIRKLNIMCNRSKLLEVNNSFYCSVLEIIWAIKDCKLKKRGALINYICNWWLCKLPILQSPGKCLHIFFKDKYKPIKIYSGLKKKMTQSFVSICNFVRKHLFTFSVFCCRKCQTASCTARPAFSCEQALHLLIPSFLQMQNWSLSLPKYHPYIWWMLKQGYAV